MNKLTDTYRHLSIWILSAVLVNLLFPSVMEAAQLFCQDAPTVHTTEIYTSSSCWMDIASDATQTDLSHNSCSLDQICEQTITTGLSETLVTQQQNLHASGVLLTSSKLNTYLKPAVKKVSHISQDILQVQDIYLLNSVFLN